MPKTKTLDQIQAMQEKAVRFVRDVLGDSDRADELEDLSPEGYAERKRVQISNPKKKGRKRMATTRRSSRTELEARIEELEEENEALNDKLDSILDIATEEESDEEDDSEDDDN